MAIEQQITLNDGYTLILTRGTKVMLINQDRQALMGNIVSIVLQMETGIGLASEVPDE